MNFILSIKSVFISVIMLSLCTLQRADYQTLHGYLSDSFKKITSFSSVSFQQCSHQCFVRVRCLSLTFHVPTRSCALSSTTILVTQLYRRPGFVTMYGFERPTGSINCNNLYCNERETCSPGPMCSIKECGTPSNTYYQEFLGNQFTIGSVLMVVTLGTRTTQATCLPDGTWQHDFTSVCLDPTSRLGVEFCDQQTESGRWMVFQRRHDGSVDFYRGWDDYVKGFGKPTGEHWLGLQLIHHITNSARYELRIDLEDFEGGYFYAEYGSFRLSGSDSNYTMYVDSYTGDAGDCFSYMNNAQFTTYDRDNDICPCNCAQSYLGGWWYTKCHISNLNGVYSPVGNVSDYAININWSCLNGLYYSFKRTDMKMRKVT